MPAKADETWECPYCDHQVRYGQGCASADFRSCELGEKNIHWVHALNKKSAEPSKGIGISEIANDDEKES